MTENRSGVLLLSAMPEGHAHLLEALRHRGIPAEAARSGQHAMMKLRSHPVLVLVDFVYGASLDRMSVERLNAARRTSTVLGLHDGDLGRVSDELEDLVVDGFCRAGDWSPIVDKAAQSFDLIAVGQRD